MHGERLERVCTAAASKIINELRVAEAERKTQYKRAAEARFVLFRCRAFIAAAQRELLLRLNKLSLLLLFGVHRVEIPRKRCPSTIK